MKSAVALLFALPLFLIAGNTSTTTVLGSSPNPSVFGHPVTLTATVTPSAATGRVTFYDGAAVLGTAQLTSGHATLTTRLLPSLTQPLRAHYAGDSTYAPSTSATVAQTVNAVAGGNFQSGGNYPAGGLLEFMAAGDFNGDGKVDVATVGLNNALNVLLGNGDGSFQKAASYSIPGGAGVAVGDFNGDGAADLAVATFGTDVSVLLGTGNGGFGPPASYPAGGTTTAIAVGDFDGDGKADLVATDAEGQVHVLLGDGAGNFGAPITSNAGSYLHGVAVGDFNGDGKTDLAVADYFGSSVDVLLGNGDGTFLPPVPYSTGGSTWEVAVADLNGDGKLDLAAVSGKNVLVFLGNGAGAFTAGGTYSLGNYASGIAIGDWDGDGKADLIVSIGGDNAISVLPGDGSGAFGAGLEIPTTGVDPTGVVVGDLNGDGRADLAIANQSSGDVTVMLNQPPAPDLSVTVTHVANVLQGQNQGVQYLITVSNLGSLPTSGTITVTDPLPTGFAAYYAFGTGWSCSMQPVSCTRSDPLAAFSSFPIITVLVTVAIGAPNSSNNTVTVSGGGETNTTNDTASDFLSTFSQSQINAAWTPVPSPTGLTFGEDAFLMTDGSVLVQQYCSGAWFKLTPDAFGNYATGTWSQAASMPAGYAPQAYSSAVLADGRLVVSGGEYNAPCVDPILVTLGAVYDPKADTWTSLAPPNGWLQVGDAPNTVLPGGQFLMGAYANPGCCQFARLDPVTLTWTLLPGTGKSDPNSEEGWTLLADGSLLTIDTTTYFGSERYLPQTDTWISAGTTPVQLSDNAQEMGPQVLRPDGTVFVVGASGHTAIFDSATDKWAAGPDFPFSNGKMINGSDVPGALLPSGNVLVTVSGGNVFEFDGTILNPVPAPPSSYCFALLPLPNGQTLCSFQTLSLYNPAGSPNPAWAPSIGAAPNAVQPGQTYTISGTQFNGLSQAVGFGDDYQAATNYPLVRIVNSASGHVFYCRTHDHSTMGVATGATTVSTHFDVPASIEAGPSTLVVVANGIPSQPVNVTVNGLEVTPANPSIAKGLTQQFTATSYSGGSATNVTSSVAWNSATPAVATITTGGLATAVASSGTSVITATSGVQASTTLTAIAAPLQSISVSPSGPSIAKGLTQQFTATGHYTDDSTQNVTASVTWSSAAATIATVNNAGLATGVGVGTSNITATLSGVTSPIDTLTVTAAILQSIAVTPANPSIPKGLTQPFTAIGTYSDGSTQNLTASVTWNSATPAVATVNSAGLATAVSIGSSNITASLGGITSPIDALTVTAAILQSIAVTPANPSIPKGLTQQFAATGTYSDGSSQNLTASVTWNSATPTVATINSAGLATGLAAGASNVTASLSGITSPTDTLTVTATLQSIAVTPVGPVIAKGLTRQLTATGTYSDNSTQDLTASVTWNSATPAVATINAAGLATGVGLGTSNITASLSGITSPIDVLTVSTQTLVSIAVTPASPSLAKGLTQQLTATGTYTDSSTTNLTFSVTWNSANTAVATINSAGLATGVAVGTSNITASLVGITSPIDVMTVTAATLQSIAVTPANPSIAKGLTKQFTATGKFTDNTTQDFTASATWSSTNTTTATVSGTGLATAAAVGSSTIGATVNGVTGSTLLTVTAAALQSIAVTPPAPSIVKGLKQQFTATGTYTDGSTQDITTSLNWNSATTTIATINNLGVATGAGVGTSNITAFLNGVTSPIDTLTVTAATLQSITVRPINSSFAKGVSVQFTATGIYSDNSQQTLTSQVTWASSNTTTAPISTAGLVTAAAAGTSTISATLSSITGSTLLTVTPAALRGITVAPASPSVAPGLTQQFTATGHFSDTSTQDLTAQVTWNSAATAVATINSAGLATAVSVGTSNVTASLGSLTSAVDTLTVTAAALQSIAVTPAGPSLAQGQTQQFTATGHYSDLSIQDLTALATWNSATTTVATINSAGLATGVGGGTSSITASLSGITSPIDTLTVTAPTGSTTTALATSGSPSLFGAPVTLTATVTPASATGLVEFFNGSTIIGTGKLNSGKAQISTTLLPAGANRLSAVYGGAAGAWQPSKSAVENLSVNTQPGNGFLSEVQYDGGPLPRSVTAADFNGDGKIDLAVAALFGGVSVLLGNGDGTFQPGVNYDAGSHPESVGVADFNSDGIPDMVVGTENGGVYVLLGNGDGTFQPAVPYVASTQVYSVGVGDFNGDGIADLAVADFAGSINVLLGIGDGTFQAPMLYFGGYRMISIAVGEFNGDGIADLAVADYDGGIYTLQGNGDGTFQDAVHYDTASTPESVAVGDFNGDGKADLAVANQGGLSVLVGNGDGTFQPAVNYDAGSNPSSVAVGDFNGDGKADLVVGDQSGGVSVLLGVGNGTFQPAVPYPVTEHPFSLVVADLNGDGRADLVVSQSYTVSVLLATGAEMLVVNPTSTVQTTAPGTAFGVPLMVTLVDATGNPLAGVSVTFTSPASGASGTFSNSLSFITVVTNASGVASAVFTANSTTGGPYQVSVTAGSLAEQFVLTNFSPCDFGRQGSATVTDAQLIIHQALGMSAAKDDLDGDGVVDVVDIQIVMNAVLGLTCTTH